MSNFSGAVISSLLRVTEMATHSSILAWKIPWTEEPGWRVHVAEYDKNEQLSLHFTSRVTGLQITPNATRWRINQPSSLQYPQSWECLSCRFEMCFPPGELTLDKQGKITLGPFSK